MAEDWEGWVERHLVGAVEVFGRDPATVEIANSTWKKSWLWIQG